MKRKMSLAFLLLAGYVLLSLGNIVSVFTGITGIFRSFSISALVGQLVTIANVLLPVALLVLLIVNNKQDMKQYVWIVLLAGAALKLYGLFRTITNTLTMMGMTGFDFIGLLPSMGPWVVSVLASVLMVIGALNIKDGKNRKLIPVALLGGFIYLIPAGVGILTGSMPVLSLLRDLLLLMALCVLPGTFSDYENCVKADGVGMKAVAVVLVVVLIVVGAAAIASDDSSSHRGGDGVNTCRICGRNTSLVAGFGMCGECYYDFNDWLDGD